MRDLSLILLAIAPNALIAHLNLRSDSPTSTSNPYLLDLHLFCLLVSFFLPWVDVFLCTVLRVKSFAPAAGKWMPMLGGVVPAVYCGIWVYPLVFGLWMALAVREADEDVRFRATEDVEAATTGEGWLRSRAATPPATRVRPVVDLRLWRAWLVAAVAMGGLYVLVNVAAYATGLWTVIGEEGRIDRTVHGIVAVYAIPAQMALGLFAFGAYMLVEGDSVVSKLWMAAVVALLYQGAVTGSYGLVEGGRF